MARDRPRVYLHIGEAKSGTTYLQETMWDNRAALRRAGLLYPGADWPMHVFAALDLRRQTMRGDGNQKVSRSWRTLVDEIRRWGGPTAIISQELLAGAGPRQIAEALASLDFADVHLVYTCRDMARTLPASWQERVRNRETESYADFVSGVRAATPLTPGTPIDDLSSRQFWLLHDTPSTLARWSASLPPERVHVVTVPGRGGPPSLLWERFAGVLGVADTPLEHRRERTNTSLSAAAAGVLRDTNIAIGGPDYSWPVYDRVMKHRVAHELADRSGTPIALPAADFGWACEWSAHVSEHITAAGYDVAGDLSELVPKAPLPGADPDSAPTAERADAALVGMIALARQIASDDATQFSRFAPIEEELRHAQARLAEHRDLAPRARIRRCVIELSEQVPWLGRARMQYRKMRGRRQGQDPAGEES